MFWQNQWIQNIIQTVINTLISLWAFHWIEPTKSVNAVQKCSALFGLIMLRMVLSPLLRPFTSIEWLAPTIKLLSTIPFLLLWKALPLSRACYYTFLLWLSFTSCSNILQSPLLQGMIGGTLQLLPDETASYFLNLAIAAVLNCVLVSVVFGTVPVNKIHRVGRERWLLTLIIGSCDLYIIYTQRITLNLDFRGFTLYLAIIQLFILASLISFERFLYSSALAYERGIEELTGRYTYMAAQAKQDAEQQIHQLHHDMKNHLLALRFMRHEPEAIDSYIGQLVEQLSEYETVIRTGNSLLDGLLTDKAAMAAHHGVECSYDVDFRACAYVSDADLCTIFGNAMDNAIEGCKRVGANRQVRVRTMRSAGNLIVSVCNPYDGRIARSGSTLLTLKADKELHGFGLNGIRRSVEKYGGSVSVDISVPNEFTLLLYFPIRETSADGSLKEK